MGPPLSRMSQHAFKTAPKVDAAAILNNPIAAAGNNKIIRLQPTKSVKAMAKENFTGTTGVIADILTVIGISLLFLASLYGIILFSHYWKRILKERILVALKSRKNHLRDDTFRQANGYSWDFIIVFRIYMHNKVLTEAQIANSMQSILSRLSKGGMDFKLFYSLNCRKVFCKIRCPLDRLLKYCDECDYKLLFDHKALRKECSTGREGLWDALTIPDTSELTVMNPYNYIYGIYKEDYKYLYRKWEKLELSLTSESDDDLQSSHQIKNPLSIVSDSVDERDKATTALQLSHLLRGVDRLKLMHLIIHTKSQGCCGLDTARLLQDQCILAYAPLHDVVELRLLTSNWLLLFAPPWQQPLDEVRNYLGEKIALYFKWLGHYTSWLIISSVVGTMLWIGIAADANSPNAVVLPYFAMFIAVWSALVLKHWKRVEKTTALEWGMIGFEDEEVERPQFVGEKRPSAVTGKRYTHFPTWKRAVRGVKTQGVVISLVLVVLALIACIYTIKFVVTWTTAISYNFKGLIISIMLAALIIALNEPFQILAIKLNDYENHRTNTEYEDALISKIFFFQFFNSYSALFFVAFLQPFLPAMDTCQGGCMVQMQVTLAVIFISRLLVDNLVECLYPLLQSYRHAVKSSVRGSTPPGPGDSVGDSAPDMRHQISEVELYYYLPEYHEMLGTLNDYAETVIQFGYSSMFVTAFPLSCLMALVNNYVEIRLDAWKMLELHRRPLPRSCEDMGTWYPILEAVSVASIFVNSGIIAFTSSILINWTWTVRVWTFILLSSALLSIKLIIDYIVPDTPIEVEIQLKRQKYLVDKVLNNVDDEDQFNFTKGLYITPNYLVDTTDEDPL